MDSFLSRHKNLIALTVVLMGQVFGLATQVKLSATQGGISLMRLWTISTVTPVEKALVNSQNGVFNGWKNYFYLRNVRKENAQLRDQIEQMRLEQVRLQQDALQAKRLQALFDFKEQFISATLPAQVIGSGGTDQSRILYIDKGSEHGVKTDQAVIAPNGIVGKILRTTPTTSQVLMVNDQLSGVGATLEKSRLQGILAGTPNGQLILKYIMKDEKVEQGETVVTSGGDRIFPKGLPIGVVAESANGKDMFLDVRVKPSANLSKVEEVLVVTRVVERQRTEDETNGPVKASDILAERLPSVPQKPVDPNAKPGDPHAKAADSATPKASDAGAKPAQVTKPGTAASPKRDTTTAKKAEPQARKTDTANKQKSESVPTQKAEAPQL